MELKLEQLERLRSEDTPRRLMVTHTIESYWIPSQKKTKSKLQIKKIRQNMKWIRWVLLKIHSGHDSVHRRTDGQTDKVIPVYPPFNFVEAGGIMTPIYITYHHLSPHSQCILLLIGSTNFMTCGATFKNVKVLFQHIPLLKENFAGGIQ